MPALYEQNFKIAEITQEQRQTARKLLLQMGLKLIARISAEMDRQGINYQGDAKKSLNAEVQQRGGKLVLTVGFGVDYAAAIELGHGPRWVPIEPLQQWTRKKLGLQGSEADRAAQAIQQKLGTEGRDGDFPLRNTMRQHFDRLAKEFVRDLRRALDDE